MFDFLKNKPFKCFVGEHEDSQLLSRSYKGIKPIDIDKIVGTVGRCHDNSSWRDLKVKERYTGIKKAVEEMKKLPPIEVYKVEDEYYIVDGHHRVMASRDIDRHFIDAEIIEYQFKDKQNNCNECSNKDYHDCPMKDFNEKTGLWGIILKSREAYSNLLDSILEFGNDVGKNLSLREIASKWYQNNYLSEHVKESKEDDQSDL